MSSIEKASQVVPGMFVDLTGVKLPALPTGGMGRRHVPNWVRSVRTGRKYVYLTLGDYRIVKLDKNEAFEEEKPFCFCGKRMKITFFCPKHEPLVLEVWNPRQKASEILANIAGRFIAAYGMDSAWVRSITVDNFAGVWVATQDVTTAGRDGIKVFAKEGSSLAVFHGVNGKPFAVDVRGYVVTNHGKSSNLLESIQLDA